VFSIKEQKLSARRHGLACRVVVQISLIGHVKLSPASSVVPSYPPQRYRNSQGKKYPPRTQKGRIVPSPPDMLRHDMEIYSRPGFQKQ
jgi:hypothetical protein